MKYFFFLFVFVGLAANAQVQSKAYNDMLRDLLDHSVTEISVSDIEGEGDGYIFLDAREKNEFKVSHIKNAVWVGYDDFKLSRVKDIPKTKKIVVYCSVGYRSEKVSEKLVAAGYTNVQNLYGSIFEWVNQGKPVYDMKGGRTEFVHAYDREWGKWLTKGKKVYNN